jgi:hypothetical protein
MKVGYMSLRFANSRFMKATAGLVEDNADIKNLKTVVEARQLWLLYHPRQGH